MKKTLLICAMAACVAGCAEQRRDEYVMGYEYVPAYTSCTTCAQPISTCNTCNTCNTCLQPVLHQQPKQVVVVMPPAPAPQPIVEHEIVYEPQPTCGCSKCECNKKAKNK